MAMVPGPNEAAWEALCSALGVSPVMDAGDRFATSGEGVPLLSGVLHGAQRSESISEYRLLLDEGSGTAFLAAEGHGDQVALSVWLYLYGPSTPGEADWTAWLAGRFPVPEPAES